MIKTKVFDGAKVFMSRSLVPPEVFDALLDALRLNGAEIFLCCDPSRNASNDYHVISSPEHEKFEDLKAKGCNLLGPQCVLSCAKDKRPLPKNGFTCCLAMDGLKILASGFEASEKVKIGKLVTAMGGILHAKTTSDVSFVIVKNVLAAKYKWALNIQKKPIVTVNWLYQCWSEHRVVPQELYRVLPFSGLVICVTRIPTEERKEIEKLIIQNGGKYSAELTKNCTHLVADAAEGDKYKVARKWGHINIVRRTWLDQSIARRVCLSEEAYPVQGKSAPQNRGARVCLTRHLGQENVLGNSESMSPTAVAESNCTAFTNAQFGGSTPEAFLSQNISCTSAYPSTSVEITDRESVIPPDEINVAECVANDSQSEDNDIYLSECNIMLIGYEGSEMRKLVSMLREGGGSRYMSFYDKLTHIVVGTPSEVEKKEARSLAAAGIQVVRTNWLEDCDRTKRLVTVEARHLAHDLIQPKGYLPLNKGVTGVNNMSQGKVSAHQSMPMNPSAERTSTAYEISLPLEKKIEEKSAANMNGDSFPEAAIRSSDQKKNTRTVANDKNKGHLKMQHDSKVQNLGTRKSAVFTGNVFCFSNSFPEERKAEIVEWVIQGGGEMVDDPVNQNVHFTIECHGIMPKSTYVPQTTYVSSHWVRSCLEDGCLLDVGSHILYSPLTCQIPFPGFQNVRFCVSQYEEKDRLLLRNLCFVLGAKFVEKLSKRVTHLLCKFTGGPKYEAACKWGIHSVTSEWIFECVRQNQVVPLDLFCPKEVTSQDREGGYLAASQFPTQSMRFGERPSQIISQPEGLESQLCDSLGSKNGGIRRNRNDIFREDARKSVSYSKKARLLEDCFLRGLVSSEACLSDPVCPVDFSVHRATKGAAETSQGVPDVASAIEDLLEQTSKIQDQISPERTSCTKSLPPSECNAADEGLTKSPSVIGLSSWINKSQKSDDPTNPSENVNAGLYGGFSETQTDSQVVSYEEDMLGRQMLIDRVRIRSSLL